MTFIKEKIDRLQNFLFYIFIFLLPWQTRYIFSYLTLGQNQYEYGKLSIYFSEIFLFILFFVFIVSWIFFGANKKKTSKRFLLAFLLFLISSVSYYFAIDKGMYFYGILRFSEAIFLMLILSKINLSWFRIVIVFVFSMSVHAILGIYQFFSQYISPSKYFGISEQVSNMAGSSVLENSYGRFLRAYGGLSHPNIFAGFLLVSILFLFLVYLKKYREFNYLKKTIFWFSLIITLNAFVLTFSRSAFLALLISGAIFLLYSLHKKLFKKILPVFIVICVVFLINLFIFVDLLKARAISTERLELKSSEERIELQEQAMKIIKQNYFTGIGLNNYIPYVYNRVDSNLEIYKYQPVHNVSLLIFVELGALGFIIYFIFVLYSFLENIKAKNEYGFIFALIMLSMFIVGLFDHYFWTSFSGLLLFFIIMSFKDLKNLN